MMNTSEDDDAAVVISKNKIAVELEQLQVSLSRSSLTPTATATSCCQKMNSTTSPQGSSLSLDRHRHHHPGTDSLSSPLLIGDAGFGLPREARPRKEKILAIARQLANFIEWQNQQQQHQQQEGKEIVPAKVRVVACADESVRLALEERTVSLLHPNVLPSHVSFSCQSLEDACRELSVEYGHYSTNDDEKAFGISIIPTEPSAGAAAAGSIHPSKEQQENTVCCCYLSPDAKASLDPCQKPPLVVVVGLLIDRRMIQTNRSQDRATTLNLATRRWPLEECFGEISANEPLNVDCVMEGMQQWWWNHDQLVLQQNQQQQQQLQEGINDTTSTTEAPHFRHFIRETFVSAASQAIQHHAERHPSRPIHLQTTTK